MMNFRVNPAADENNALRWSSQNGHIEVVKILLGDYRVDPGRGAKMNNPVRIASQKGYLEIVQLLCADHRVGKLYHQFIQSLNF